MAKLQRKRVQHARNLPASNVMFGKLSRKGKTSSYSLVAVLDQKHIGGIDFTASSETQAIKDARKLLRGEAKDFGIYDAVVMFNSRSYVA